MQTKLRWCTCGLLEGSPVTFAVLWKYQDVEGRLNARGREQMQFHPHRVCGLLESYTVTLPIKFNLLSLNSNCFSLPNFCLERVILWSRFFSLEFRYLIFTPRPHCFTLTQLTATSATWTDDIDLCGADWTDKSSKCRLFIKTLTCTIATPQQERFCNLRLNLTFASSRFLGTKHCNFKKTKIYAMQGHPTTIFGKISVRKTIFEI